jgi:hypothetical protein
MVFASSVVVVFGLSSLSRPSSAVTSTLCEAELTDRVKFSLTVRPTPTGVASEDATPKPEAVTSTRLSMDELHNEAERLEHFISESFEERIAAKFGHPTADPTATAFQPWMEPCGRSRRDL